MPEAPPGSWPPQLPEALRRFVDLFNAGAYWESHEVLEEPWRALRSDFYQGLIIYASAFVHAQRGNPVGIRKQLAKVQRKLPSYRPHYLGIDVDQLLATTERLVRLVESSLGLPGPSFSRRFPYPRLELKEAFIRGDEPELGTAL